MGGVAVSRQVGVWHSRLHMQNQMQGENFQMRAVIL